MADSTIYDIRLRYLVEDRASRGVGALADQSARAARANSDLVSSLKTAAAFIGGGALVQRGKAALIDFNSEMEGLKIEMSQVIALNLHQPFEQAEQAAGGLFSTFQELARSSPGTTKDFVQLGNALVGPLLNAKGELEDLPGLTRGIILAKGNIPAELAALDVEQMLAGTTGKRDRFARRLIESHGMSTEKFNALSAPQRLEKTKEFLNDPAILAAAKRYEESWAGATSTLQDTLEHTLGKVGLPLFKEITAEVRRWNEWIDKNPGVIQDWTAKFSHALTEGFASVRDTVGFIVEHKDTILKLAEVWLAWKVLGAGGGGAGGRGGAAGSLGAVATGGLGGFALGQALGMEPFQVQVLAATNALSALPGTAGLVGQALTGLHAGLQLFASWIDDQQAASIQAEAELASAQISLKQRDMIVSAANAVAGTAGDDRQQANENLLRFAGGLLTGLRDNALLGAQGVLDSELGRISEGKLGEALIARGMDEATARAAAYAAKEAVDALGKDWFTDFIIGRSGKDAKADEKKDEKRATKRDPSINVNIQRVEVAAKNPGQMVFGLAELARKAVRAPTRPRRR